MGDPHISGMPKLEHVLRGIKKDQSKNKGASKPRLPMIPDILMKLGLFGNKSQAIMII